MDTESENQVRQTVLEEYFLIQFDNPLCTLGDLFLMYLVAKEQGYSNLSEIPRQEHRRLATLMANRLISP